MTGASGSGKSTLLNLLGGLDTPTAGTIEVQGRRISDLDAGELALYRRHSVGMIFQSFNLIPSLTALENVALPLMFAGVPKRQRKSKAGSILERVGLKARLSHRPAELSGGEQQRVAIARALINDPLILLADEPTGNLDTKTTSEIMKLLQKLNANGMTIIMVTHSPSCARYARRIMEVSDGRLVADDYLSGSSAVN